MEENTYLFIDESGDPGYKIEDEASSRYYLELALQINSDISLRDIIAHIITWKYTWGILRETKSLPKDKDGVRYFAPILELHYQGKLNCSCVYLLKESYNGPYLKPEMLIEQNPLYFRNFIHKELLKHHFAQFPISEEARIHLIFDDYTMEFEDIRNAEDYLQNNWDIPNFWRILHANSISNIALQVASQLVGAVKDIALGTITDEREQLLSFIALKDITNIN